MSAAGRRGDAAGTVGRRGGGGGAAIMSYSGYESYNYGYGYGQDNSGNYGYGMAASNSWDMGNSDMDMNPDGAGSADTVIAKMNQRLDMVSHLDADSMQGGQYGSGGDRSPLLAIVVLEVTVLAIVVLEVTVLATVVLEEGEDEEGRDSEKGALTIQEEISQIKRKLQAGKKTQERQKKRHRDRMVERIQYVCSLCKYRTFYDDEMSSHLESKFHKEHFKFVGTKLPQQTANFLQEYVANKTRKTEERRKAIEDINAVIQQIYRDQDLTQDIGMEHFIKKVEAAHCAACDLFIPMQYGIIQKHLKSLDHNHNRRVSAASFPPYECLFLSESSRNADLLAQAVPESGE
ncbi:UNVERIFIED_CONTAM: hypothetical protein H355_003230 [Colinus virginianus]|nr:hypothetical protein H355_003230 [Colinus virginianus]